MAEQNEGVWRITMGSTRNGMGMQGTRVEIQKMLKLV